MIWSYKKDDYADSKGGLLLHESGVSDSALASCGGSYAMLWVVSSSMQNNMHLISKSKPKLSLLAC